MASASQTVNPPKTSYLYYVVEFPDENIDDEVPMSVISYSWVSYNDETGIPTCMWPKRATDAQRIQMTQKHKIPTSFIPGIRINIKYKALTYEKAVSKMKELERIQSVTQSEASETEQRRKRAIKPKHYDDFTSSAESEDDLPKIKTKYTNKVSKRPKTDISVEGIPDQYNDTDLPYRTTPLGTPSTSSRSSPYRITPLGTPTSSQSYFYNRCTCESNEVLLKKVLITVQSLNNEIKIIKQCLSKSDDIPEDNELLKTFPLTTQEQLENFNDTLTENASNLVPFCQLIGGKDVVDTTRRLLTKIVGQNLAESYNWCGKNNKPAFCHLKNIVNFIVGVVRKNKFSKNATQQEVEMIIKSWLRTATDRNGGRNRRRKNVPENKE